MFTSRRVTRTIALAGAAAAMAATSAAAAALHEPTQMPPAGVAASTVQPDQGRPPRGTSVNPGQDPHPAMHVGRPDTAGNPEVSSYAAHDTSAAVAHEQYLRSYGAPRPLSAPPAPSDETPWQPIVLSIAGALIVVAASAAQVRRARSRRRTLRATA